MEERKVRVDGRTETWRVFWRDTPRLVCLRNLGCDCYPFAHGQAGEADLLRTRAGLPDEVFPIEQIYAADLDTPTRGSSESVFRRWPNLESDEAEELDDDQLVALIRARPLIPVLDLRDYDHDGRATEFELLIGGVGCVFHHSVVVGLSRSNSRLHIFTAAGSNRPLELSPEGWAVLRSKAGRGTYVENPCGNYGSPIQDEITLWTDGEGIHAHAEEYDCTDEFLQSPGRVRARRAKERRKAEGRKGIR